MIVSPSTQERHVAAAAASLQSSLIYRPHSSSSVYSPEMAVHRRARGGQRQPLDRVPVNRGGPSASKKEQKNAREKERVKNVREEYEALGAVLGSQIERGSGHFSKVGTLAAAIRNIRELQETVEQTTTQESGTVGVEPSPPPLPPPPPQINLNCDERLEVDSAQQAANASFDGFFQEEIVSTYTEVAPDDLPPAYFSYNSGADFPPVMSSPCLFSLPSESPGPTLPPPSSLVYSPEMAGHLTHSSGTAPASIGEPLSPLGVSPPSYSCGSDVWMAIGCN
jgi:hypothetical protein